VRTAASSKDGTTSVKSLMKIKQAVWQLVGLDYLSIWETSAHHGVV
jgi:hypothetical protein